jgi:hypothetical protein
MMSASRRAANQREGNDMGLDDMIEGHDEQIDSVVDNVKGLLD